MAYKISKKYKGKDRNRIHQIIKSGIDKNLTTNQIQKNLQKENLGYTRKNIFHDIRLKKASYNIGVKDDGTITYTPTRTRKGRINKQKWFVDVFEKFRIDNNLTTHQARKLIKQEMVTSHKSNAEIELGAKFYDIYKQVFA